MLLPCTRDQTKRHNSRKPQKRDAPERNTTWAEHEGFFLVPERNGGVRLGVLFGCSSSISIGSRHESKQGALAGGLSLHNGKRRTGRLLRLLALLGHNCLIRSAFFRNSSSSSSSESVSICWLPVRILQAVCECKQKRSLYAEGTRKLRKSRARV